MALLGLLLLPSDFRAGAETAHAHSLVQLWADAADGSIHHHHVAVPSSAHRAEVLSWLDPAVQTAPESTPSELATVQPDVGEHQDSTTAASGVHVLVNAVATILLATARCAPSALPSRQPASRFPRVLLPPPRWTPAAI